MHKQKLPLALWTNKIKVATKNFDYQIKPLDKLDLM